LACQAALRVAYVRIEAGLGGKGLVAEAAAGEAAMEAQVIEHGLPVCELLLAKFTVKDAAQRAYSNVAAAAISCPTSPRRPQI
jgi:hypothetical protein